MRINNNISAINTHRQYNINNSSIAKSTEKLSSGYRINRAGDDAAGLAISEKMRAQIRGLTMASKNSQDAISLIQTAEGALQESHNILQRMREIAVQSASDTNETTIDRGALEQEFQQLIKELDDTANKTRFNDQNLIDGTFQKESIKIASAAGFANLTNTHIKTDTAAGTYTHTIGYTAASPTYVGGATPTTSASFAAAKITAFDIGGLAALTGSDTAATSVKLASVTQSSTNEREFELQIEIDTANGKDIVTYTAELAANGSFAISAVGAGLGSTLTITAAAGTTADQALSELKAMEGKTVLAGAFATNTANFVGSAELTTTYAPGTITNRTDELNGVYTFEVTGTNTDANIVLKNANGDKVFELNSLDLSTMSAAAATKAINLGQYGTITLTHSASTTAPTIADLQAALNGQTISIEGGINEENTGTAAAATVTTNANETIDLTVGMDHYVTKEGIRIDFAKALTALDFADQNSFRTAVGGSFLATIKVEQVIGKDMVIQTGANEGDNLAINIDKMDAWNLGVDLSSVSTREGASKAITEVNNAINQVSTQRAALGALQNRLDHKIANLDTSAENLTSAESRIRDIDMAKEMTNFTKNNILFQASTAMLAQANAMPQGVLQLLG